MPSEGENDHENPIALCKRKGIRGYDADPDVRRRSCAISGNNTLGSLTGLSETAPKDVGSLARTPFESLRGTRDGGGYDPMDRPYRSRGLRNGGTFYSVVIS
jgi:hypothetical protein